MLCVFSGEGGAEIVTGTFGLRSMELYRIKPSGAKRRIYTNLHVFDVCTYALLCETSKRFNFNI